MDKKRAGLSIEPVDLAEVSDKLVALEEEMDETDKVVAGFCEELGIKAPF